MSRAFTSLRNLRTASLARSFTTSKIMKNNAIPASVLNSIEDSWKGLSVQQQEELTAKIELLEKQDWSKLSVEEKRASYYVAFGPHGPREPAPKVGFNVFLGTIAIVVAGGLSFVGIRALGNPQPHTMTKEWQEATNEYMKEQKANPISGYTSEGYKGNGWLRNYSQQDNTDPSNRRGQEDIISSSESSHSPVDRPNQSDSYLSRGQYQITRFIRDSLERSEVGNFNRSRLINNQLLRDNPPNTSASLPTDISFPDRKRLREIVEMEEKASNGIQNGKGNENGIDAEDKNKSEEQGLVLFDNNQIIRLINQYLTNAGLLESAEKLEQETGIALESDVIAQIRNCVLNGQWDEAENLIVEVEVDDVQAIIFYIRQQKFLELLEKREYTDAVHILQHELAPLEINIDRLHLLASLLFCKNISKIKSKADWDGSEGQSRYLLLEDIQQYIPASVMIPRDRLMTLLNQAVRYQRRSCFYHNNPEPSDSLFSDHRCGSEKFPLQETMVINDHDDEIWHIEFSNNGKYLASASKDSYANIWSLEESKTIHTLQGHKGSVSLICWSFDDKYILTCGSDFKAMVWEARSGRLLKVIDKHKKIISACVWVPNSHSFITSSGDKKTYLWDVNGTIQYTWDDLIVTNILLTKDSSKMVVTSNNQIKIFDFSTKKVIKVIDEDAISISLSNDEEFILFSRKDSGLLNLWSLDQNKIIQRYTGHAQTRYVIRSCFGGAKGDYVLSGSEDNNIYVWTVNEEEAAHVLKGHSKMVNVVCWNKAHGNMFASASDDATIRIWT
ncbi:WD40 repeat-like protein [Neoconidiobolus thromboides FSU 785]|nr:WD40 repeat-like protein [Neoconidiobolus thromboides FSU 785]